MVTVLFDLGRPFGFFKLVWNGLEELWHEHSRCAITLLHCWRYIYWKSNNNEAKKLKKKIRCLAKSMAKMAKCLAFNCQCFSRVQWIMLFNCLDWWVLYNIYAFISCKEIYFLSKIITKQYLYSFLLFINKRLCL